MLAKKIYQSRFRDDDLKYVYIYIAWWAFHLFMRPILFINSDNSINRRWKLKPFFSTPIHYPCSLRLNRFLLSLHFWIMKRKEKLWSKVIDFKLHLFRYDRTRLWSRSPHVWRTAVQLVANKEYVQIHYPPWWLDLSLSTSWKMNLDILR